MGYRIGIDVGGTFTDFVAVNTDQQMYSGKTPTIATDEAASVFGGLEQIAAHFGVSLQTLLAETDPVVLGTTVDGHRVHTRGRRLPPHFRAARRTKREASL